MIEIIDNNVENLNLELDSIYSIDSEETENNQLDEETLVNIKNLISSSSLDNFVNNLKDPDYFKKFDYKELAELFELFEILFSKTKEIKEKIDIDIFFKDGYNLDIGKLKEMFKNQKLSGKFPNLDFKRLKELYQNPPEKIKTYYDELQEIKIDPFVYRKYLIGLIQMIFNEMDLLVCSVGPEGCLSGDTEIQISRKKLSRRYTIERLYNAYHNNELNLKKYRKWDLNSESYIRAFNGKDIKLHKIKAVHYSGIKRVFELSLDNNKKIKATSDHKFLTKSGWKQLQDLEIGEKLMCDTLKAEKNKRKRIKLYDVQLKVDYHQYTKNGRVEVHRLIYESYINGLKFTEYLDILLNEEEKSSKLKYIDPNKYHIHHKDGCHYNNSIDNLELLTKEGHLNSHSDNMYSNFSQGSPKWAKVESIKYVREEKTYDIECEEPYHNFVANGIVVHNSGKSTKISQDMLMVYWTLKEIRIIDYEFDIKEIWFNTLYKFREAEDRYFKVPFRIIGLDEGNELNRQDWKDDEVKTFFQRLRRERFNQRIKFICLPVLGELITNIVLSRMNFISNMLNKNQLRTGTLHKGEYEFYIIPRGDTIYSPFHKKELSRTEIKSKLFINLKDKEYLKGMPKEIIVKKCKSNGVWGFKKQDYIRELKESNKTFSVNKGVTLGLMELFMFYKSHVTAKKIGIKKNDIRYSSLAKVINKINTHFYNDPDLLLKYEAMYNKKIEDKEES